MSDIQNLTVNQLRKAVAIKEQIEQLRNDLASVLRSGKHQASESMPAAKRKKHRMSAAGRARIAAAAKARWAKIKNARATKKPRKKMSAAVRAKFSAMAKARWKKAKAAGKNAL